MVALPAVLASVPPGKPKNVTPPLLVMLALPALLLSMKTAPPPDWFTIVALPAVVIAAKPVNPPGDS